MQPPDINSAVSALRFFFTVTLDRPEPFPPFDPGSPATQAAACTERRGGRAAVRRSAGQCSEGKRRRAGLDAFVHLARAGDLDTGNEVVLLVAARLHARRAGPELSAAL
jgi:hypothetical protein